MDDSGLVISEKTDYFPDIIKFPKSFEPEAIYEIFSEILKN
jgi:hypothetical protein